jgi:hypothetical protein
VVEELESTEPTEETGAEIELSGGLGIGCGGVDGFIGAGGGLLISVIGDGAEAGPDMNKSEVAWLFSRKGKTTQRKASFSGRLKRNTAIQTRATKCE